MEARSRLRTSVFLRKLRSLSERIDICSWVDTTVMAADCLTKLMKETYLQAIIESNIWNTTQTDEAKAIKLRKSEGVQRRKQQRRAEADVDVD